LVHLNVQLLRKQNLVVYSMAQVLNFESSL
jgi:hypothetical protein